MEWAASSRSGLLDNIITISPRTTAPPSEWDDLRFVLNGGRLSRCTNTFILSNFVLTMHRLCPIYTIHQLYKHINIVTSRKLCCRKDISGSNEPLQRYRHSKLFKMATCRELGFDVTGNSAIRCSQNTANITAKTTVTYRVNQLICTHVEKHRRMNASLMRHTEWMVNTRRPVDYREEGV